LDSGVGERGLAAITMSLFSRFLCSMKNFSFAAPLQTDEPALISL